jgi:phosphoenolpyruvate carboxylase
LPIIEKYTAEYIRQLKLLVDPINAVARYIPKRRKRKLHTGLFGYSRNLGDMQLPRAITFTAALYSLGIPPELLGLNALTPGDIEEIKKCYANIVYDIGMSARLANVESPFFPKELLSSLSQFTNEKDLNLPHKEMTSIIAKSIQEKPYADVSGEVLRAANIRGFLG